MDTIKNHFLDLYKDNKAYAILQIGYAIVAVISLIICGFIALINQDLGTKLLIAPCVASAILGINALFWAIIKSILDSLSKTQKNK